MASDTEAWAIVELMGHVRLAGRISEEEKFGAKMGRIDIPNPDQSETSTGPFITQFFGGGSVYRITLVTEEVARHVAKGTTSAPISPWDFPKQLQAAEAIDEQRSYEDEHGY